MPKRMSIAAAAPFTRPNGLGGALLLSVAVMALTSALAPALGQTTTPPAAPATAAPASAAPAAAMAPAVVAAPQPAAADTNGGATPGAAGGPVSQAALQTALGREKAARIESHIDRLHADLKITAAQEPAWQLFAGTMRANAVQMDGAYSHRQQNYAGMNAVQDLQSYGEVEQTNARNIAQLLPPFQALYSALSPQQQKLADGIFVRHIDKAVKKNG